MYTHDTSIYPIKRVIMESPPTDMTRSASTASSIDVRLPVLKWSRQKIS